MAPSSDLSLAGVLYAGSDFEEWATRMSAVLRIQGCEDYTYAVAKAQNFEPFALAYDYASIAKQKALSILCSRSFVDAAILSRIPKTAKEHPYILWGHLESQSKPFRFLDLSAEMRNSVYDEVLERGTYSIRLSKRGRALPAFTQTSHQIRQEALPLFWGVRTEVVLSTGPGDQTEISQQIEGCLTAWMGAIGREPLKHLRVFDLLLLGGPPRPCFFKRRRHIRFTFSKPDGLGVAVTRGKLSPESLARLEEHVARVERDRKIVDVQAESILLAVLSEPKLWRTGELVWV